MDRAWRNNLPAFRMVNDSEEYILDGRMRLQGWKYRIVELTMGQLRTIRERSGGRLTFKVINLQDSQPPVQC